MRIGFVFGQDGYSNFDVDLKTWLISFIPTNWWKFLKNAGVPIDPHGSHQKFTQSIVISFNESSEPFLISSVYTRNIEKFDSLKLREFS